MANVDVPYWPRIQIISSPSGEEMVVVSKPEYDALIARLNAYEDAEDVAIYDARKAELSDQ